jgi:hypothetical protein
MPRILEQRRQFEELTAAHDALAIRLHAAMEEGEAATEREAAERAGRKEAEAEVKVKLERGRVGVCVEGFGGGEDRGKAWKKGRRRPSGRRRRGRGGRKQKQK